MRQAREGLRNRLLLKLSDADFDYLRPHLERVAYKLHEKLIRPNVPIAYVYFPESGQISVIAGGHDSEPIEVGVIGREGMTDMVLNAGADRTPLTYLAQVSGEAWRIAAEDYAVALRERPAIQHIALRFQQWMIIQTSYAALSHGCYTIPERLARWLLMVHDRLDGDELPLVHQFLSLMLCVRRSGVTDALHILEGQKAIRATRGKIIIVDREILRGLAGGSYGVAEAEYERLLGSEGL